VMFSNQQEKATINKLSADIFCKSRNP